MQQSKCGTGCFWVGKAPGSRCSGYSDQVQLGGPRRCRQRHLEHSMNETTSIIPRMAVLVAGLAATAITGAQPAVTPTIPVAAASGSGPRIGLALSGGGARGIAHVGVLKVLEELRVPIHCVTGTSMGAIVGGTFAAGTAAGRDGEARPRRPTGTRSSATARRARRSRSGARSTTTRRCSRRSSASRTAGSRCPRASSPASRSSRSSARWSTPAFGITDFSKLPIPFRAMATDIETGESVVLDHGSLAQAMRASMSVPGRDRRRWRSTAGCSSTAASPTTCRSTRRASSAPTSSSRSTSRRRR